MATKLTRNLKLRLSGNLSADSVYNLERLDALGAFYTVSLRDDILLRSRQDIELDPRSPDLGGSGGGVIRLGSDSNSLSELDINALVVTINGQVLPDPDDIVTLTGSGLEPDLGLPVTNGQVLKSDTNGDRYWATLTGLVASQNVAVDWAPEDGSSFTYTHGYGTSDIEVQIYDIAAGSYVSPDVVSFPDENNVTLGVVEAPTTTWKVFVREVLTL